MKLDEGKNQYVLEDGKIIRDGDLEHLEYLPEPINYTLKQRKEIAEYMINLWKEWAE